MATHKKDTEKTVASAKPRRRYLQNIWQAADKGDMDEFERHLKIVVQDGTVSDPAPTGNTILHFVAMIGHFDMFKALIDAGADYHAINGVGQSILACSRQHADKFAAYIAQHESAAIAASTPAPQPRTSSTASRL